MKFDLIVLHELYIDQILSIELSPYKTLEMLILISIVKRGLLQRCYQRLAHTAKFLRCCHLNNSFFHTRCMKQNLVVFLADMYNVLEIHPAKCVRYPGEERAMQFLDGT